MKRFVELGGLLLLILGLGPIVAGADVLHSPTFRLLMLGTTLIVVGLDMLIMSGKAERSEVLFVGGTALLGLAAGPFVLWRTYIDGGGHLWSSLILSAVILVSAWRLWRAPLALAGMAACLCLAIWPHGPGVASMASADHMRVMSAALWFDFDEGVLGWLLDAWLTKVFPFFLLGTVLADRTFLALATGSAAGSEGLAWRGVSVIHALARPFAATMIMAALIMTTRPGIDLPTTLTALLLPASALTAWFWMTAPVAERVSETSIAGWRDHLLTGTVIAMLAATQIGGITLGPSAILALGVVLVLDAAIGDRARAPTAILQRLAHGGIAFAKLTIAIATVALVLTAFDRSGAAIDLAKILAGATGEARLPSLVFAALLSIGLGATMPTLAAFLIATALIGPALRTVGVADLTLHLFVLFTCIGAELIRQGHQSATPRKLVAGTAMVGVGFAFASNPELLLVPEAFASVGEVDQPFSLQALASAVLRTGCMLSLLAVVTPGLRGQRFGLVKGALCVAAALASVAEHPLIYGLGLFASASIAASAWHLTNRQATSA